MRINAAISGAAAVLFGIVGTAAAQVTMPAGAVRGVAESTSAPAWIALPAHGQLQAPSGMEFEMAHAVVLSRSHPREAVLVGALRNRGEHAAAISLALRYFDVNGEMLQPVGENAAAVSWVLSGGLLPFRFPLVGIDQVSGRPVLYQLVALETADAPAPMNGARVKVTRTRSLGRDKGASVAGIIEFGAEPPPRDVADLVLTLLLKDADGRLLDVVSERPFQSAPPLAASNGWPFEIRTTMPVTKPVKEVIAWLIEAPVSGSR